MKDANRMLRENYSNDVLALFTELAPKAFDFLRLEHGMVGPLEKELGISFQGPDYSIEIGLDPREGLWVGLSADVDERHLSSSLQCLYVESGLGPAQSIKNTARTTHSLHKAIDTNAQALRRLLPNLKPGNRDLLFIKCHGR